ncbi:MAG: cryptochrome/photolyase family protein [Pseudomonadota bacterium]
MAQGNLILVLGDQLTPSLSSLAHADVKADVVLMAEVAEEATYVRHHKKKIAFLFSAMRHFAAELEAEGWKVVYVRLDDDGNSGHLAGEVARVRAQHGLDRIVVTEPGEWRLLDEMQGWSERLDCDVEILIDDRFIATRREFVGWASGRKQLRMEYFYREMRKKTDLLMDGDKPVGGKWNFDSENRKPAADDLFLPEPPRFKPDAVTREVLASVTQHFPDHFGDLEPFWFAVTRKDAEAARDHFVSDCLPFFGDYQDAMLMGRRFLYHSILSHYINCGLLDPLDVCHRAAKAYEDGYAPLNAVEGFVRQIIGWREFVRGIYWLKMPDYANANFFQSDRRLPDFYWTGDTGMHCLAEAIMQTKEEAYAHHIQRLMITGNFALLAGVSPAEIHEWYLAVYADAYEWVELPNVIGMSQFADGGLLGSKPYVSSGSYINKMSNYCGQCSYDVKKKTGEDACPFNALYWDFLIRNEDKLGRNARLRNPYATWRRMSAEKQQAYRDSAAQFLDQLN